MPRIVKVTVLPVTYSLQGAPFFQASVQPPTFEVECSEADTPKDISNVVDRLHSEQNKYATKWSTEALEFLGTMMDEKNRLLDARTIAARSVQQVSAPQTPPPTLIQKPQEAPKPPQEPSRPATTTATAQTVVKAPEALKTAYPQGDSVAAGNRICSNTKAHKPMSTVPVERGVIPSTVWDFSVSRYGRPLCRPCQTTAGRA